MQKFTLRSLFIALATGCVCLSGCNSNNLLQATSQPTIAASTEIATLEPTKPMPTITTTATVVYPQEKHLTLPSGLKIDEYALKNSPQVTPLTFVSVQGSQEEILAKHRQERIESFPDNSFFDGSHFSLSTRFDNQKLIAREVYTANTGIQSNPFQKASVEVLLNEKVIYTIQAGDGSPVNPLQGLWTYDKHWILEIAYVKRTQISKSEITSDATGQIVKDGELLNEWYGYQEMFGFQLVRGKPFYFFEKDGQIGVSYDNQEMLLGYESIPHYGCCSASELNPRPAKNMVAFFAQRDGIWYYVEMGAFE